MIKIFSIIFLIVFCANSSSAFEGELALSYTAQGGNSDSELFEILVEAAETNNKNHNGSRIFK